MTNSQIAEHFELLSKLMDIHGENSFKVKSYSIAAYNIEKLPAEATTMSDAELFSMKGIGDSTGKKILQLINTGHMAELDKLIAATPPGILEMMQIKGLGPKKIAIIWKEMGIESVGELEYACVENRLVSIKGFGEKTQTAILQNIAYIKQNQGFFLYSEAMNMAEGVLKALSQNLPDNKFEYTGAIRMQADTTDCIDILTNASEANLTAAFPNSETVSWDYPTLKVDGFPKIKFHTTTDNNWYTTLFQTSSSPDFLESFYSLYSMPDAPSSETEIFTHNNLAYIAPALRNDAHSLVDAAKNSLPELITVKDIKSIIHSHSKWSDGANTIEEMANAAIKQGFEYLVMSDHSQAAYYANGLTPERIAAQHAEIDALNSKLGNFKIFKSIEADILNDGSLDYTPQVLSTFDIVIASVHSNLKMSKEKAMERVMTAIANPYTTILGHPTGRLLLSREGYPLDHKTIIDACAQHHVVIEINAHPRRLDLDWKWIRYAVEKGVLLSINPDAHSTEGFKDVLFGVLAAQKAGLTAQHNLSSYSLAQFQDFIAGYKKKITG